MKKIKGPAIFLAQFAGDEEPFNNLKNIENSYATILKSIITKIQYNLIEDPYGWRSEVSAVKV